MASIHELPRANGRSAFAVRFTNSEKQRRTRVFSDYELAKDFHVSVGGRTKRNIKDPITLEFIFSKIEKDENDCWIWLGLRRKGYGRAQHQNKVVSTHRIVWELVNGPIAKGLLICHRCDNPPCCNPEHLFLGTDKDNSRDKIAKGRDRNQKKTQCPQGHPYDEINTYSYRGRRHCRPCMRERARLYREAHLETMNERQNNRRKAARKAAREAMVTA